MLPIVSLAPCGLSQQGFTECLLDTRHRVKNIMGQGQKNRRTVHNIVEASAEHQEVFSRKVTFSVEPRGSWPVLMSEGGGAQEGGLGQVLRGRKLIQMERANIQKECE